MRLTTITAETAADQNRRRKAIVFGLTMLSLLLPMAGARAQTSQSGSDAAEMPSATSDSTLASSSLMPAAIAGSAAGIAIGWSIGSSIRDGSSEDPGLVSGILMAAVGSAAGSAIAIHIASRGRVGGGTSWAAGVLGLIGGVAGSAVLGSVAHKPVPVFLGFSIGQGVFSSIVAANMEWER